MRPVWYVVGALALVVASAFTTVAVFRSGSAGAPAASPSPAVVSSDAAAATAAKVGPAADPSEPAPVASAALPLSPTVIVLDASGSMKADDAPESRIEAAKRAVTTLVDALPDGTPLGLTVYGTSTDSSEAAKAEGCQDIRTIVPLGPVDRVAFASAVSGVVASGYTPIGAALRAAVAQLPADGIRTVIVVSDGIETCAPPEACAIAREASTPGLAVHTVGFRVDAQARDQLGCIADAAGGSYVDADNAAQLAARLRSAVDPNTAVNTLTRNGFGGLELGMSVAQAQGVDPAITASESGTVRIVWRDCELTFTNGTLAAISSTGVATQDGLKVGDDVARAVELYGAAPVQVGAGSSRIVVPTGDRGDAGYDITFVPDTSDPGAMRGPITSIVLCLCRPAATGETTSATADAAVTAIIAVKPIDEHGNFLDGYYPGGDPFRQSGSGTDLERSQFGGTAYDVHGVATTGGTLHSCWPTQTPGVLECLDRLDDTVILSVQISGDAPPLTPVPVTDPSVRPSVIELDDGRRCQARTHGSTSLRLTYICGNPDGSPADVEVKSTVSQPDKSGRIWTIQQVDGVDSVEQIADRDNPPTRTATIVRAWVNG